MLLVADDEATVKFPTVVTTLPPETLAVELPPPG